MGLPVRAQRLAIWACLGRGGRDGGLAKPPRATTSMPRGAPRRPANALPVTQRPASTPRVPAGVPAALHSFVPGDSSAPSDEVSGKRSWADPLELSHVQPIRPSPSRARRGRGGEELPPVGLWEEPGMCGHQGHSESRCRVVGPQHTAGKSWLRLGLWVAAPEAQMTQHLRLLNFPHEQSEEAKGRSLPAGVSRRRGAEAAPTTLMDC